MKIEIKNLGPIHHFEFDLEKDLHLLYGENNVGKSFAVNVLYCLMKAFHENKDTLLIDNTDRQKKSNIEKIRSFWENILLKKIVTVQHGVRSHPTCLPAGRFIG